MAKKAKDGAKKGRTKKGRANGHGTLERTPSGIYMARWTAQGKRYSRSTGTRDEREAAKLLEEWTQPYRNKSDIARIEEISKTFDEPQKRLAEWQARQAGILLEDPTGKADAWTVYESSQARPRSGKATLRNYEQWYGLFVEWLKFTHADITEIGQVTQDIANQYASALLTGTPAETRQAIEKARQRQAQADKLGVALPEKEAAEVKRLLSYKVREPVRGTTLNRHLNALALVWRFVAQADNAKITVNPWAYDKQTGKGIRRVKLEKSEKAHKRRILTIEEIHKLLKAADGELRVLIALGFYTGLRLADCVLMTWGRIDRVNGCITATSLKSGTDTDTAIHPALARYLQAADTFGTGSGYVMPRLAAEYNRGTTGKVNISKAITKLFKSIGIETSYRENPDARARPDCGFHSVRHTFDTFLHRNGATPAEVQKLMGHRTQKMTAYYNHESGKAVLALPDIDISAEAVKTPIEAQVIEAQIVEATPAANTPEAVFEALRGILGKLTLEQLKEAAELIRQRINETEKK